MIEIRNLFFSYPGGDAPVVDGIDLDLRPGEFVAIMGANGSGKTSLLHCINGLQTPNRGTVHVEGLSTQNPDHLSDIRRRVGLVFQNPDDQIVSAVVEREIAFGLENLGVPTAEMHRRVDDVLARFGLERYRTHAPHLLSGGERQRLALASVVAMRPAYILLDEPTALLDPGSRREFLAFLHALRADGDVAPVLVTQIATEAAAADRLIVLHRGRIALDDRPEAIFAQAGALARLNLHPPLAAQIAPRIGLPAPLPLTPEALVARLPAPTPSKAPAAAQTDVAEPEPIVRARRLVHVYDRGLSTETIALDDLDLDLYAGQITALIGPGGSGKSTFVQHLNGLLKPASGDLSVCGQSLAATRRLRDLRRRVGLVFQFPEAQLFAETVFDDIAFGPRNLDLPDITSRVDRALEAVGLDPHAFAKRDPLRLSGGEKRRVAIAGVLAMHPDVLVLDEPTAGLDPAGVARIETLLRAQKAEGRTVLFITHDLDLAARLADRVVAFHRGRIHAAGPPHAILTAPTLAPLALPPPEIVQLADMLRQRGWPISPTCLTPEALCAELQSRGKAP